MLVPKMIDSDDLKNNPQNYEELIQVVIRSDDDGHEYLIPKELEEKFETLNAQIHDVNFEEPDDIEEQYDVHNQFQHYFNPYRLEGNQPPLYAKVGYEKEL